MTDLVERLRRERETDHLCVEAAAEIERLRAALNAVRIWMKNIDRRPTEEPLYQAVRAALEPKP